MWTLVTNTSMRFWARYTKRAVVRTTFSVFMRSIFLCWGVLPVGVGLSACSDLVNKDVSTSSQSASLVRSEAGALGRYQLTLIEFADGLGSRRNAYPFISVSGLLSDELTMVPSERFPSSELDQIDSRMINTNGPYSNLHRIRGAAQESRGLLHAYAPDVSPALVGHLFAIEGMVDVLLAELFCSGIPLSTVNFEADYTLTRGFTTGEVYHAALALFDSADTYLGDSLRLKTFVQLGRGRALLGLGQFQAAKDAVQGIATSYQYTLSYAASRQKFVPDGVPVSGRGVMIGTMEGGTGLPFGDRSDPRTTRPALMDSIAPLVVSSGIEARLIEAEAALAAGQDEWLPLLNRLRTTCSTVESCPSPAPAGDGGVSGLSLLSDPAPGADYSDPVAKEARVRLLFEERGYWLFLTGHRQGDLRRLVRTYGYPQHTVYPTGIWGFVGRYGDQVTLSVPNAERNNNPLYGGCVNHDA